MALHNIHLEQRMLASMITCSTALEEGKISADTWRLTALLSTWLHREVTLTDERIRSVTGWEQSRIHEARMGMIHVPGWRVAPRRGGGWVYNYPKARMLQEWGESWKSRLGYRTAMKMAAYFPPFDLTPDAHRVLVALGAFMRAGDELVLNPVTDRLMRLAGVKTLEVHLEELEDLGVIEVGRNEHGMFAVRYTTHTYAENLRAFQPLFFASTQERAAHEWSYVHQLEEHLGESLRLPTRTTEGRTLTIYRLIDPRDGETRYLGRTIRDDRSHQHASVWNQHAGNPRYSEWVKSVAESGHDEDGRPLQSIYEVLTQVPYEGESQADRIEAEFIHAYDGLLNSHHVSYCPARVTRECN